MRKKKMLNVLLPKTRREILAATLLHPEKAWYSSELAERMGVSPSSLQRELQDLSEAGLLNKRRIGRMVYYQANAEAPIFQELRGVLLKTTGLADVLSEALNPLAQKLSLAFVYGSIASGTELSDSDIDLMVVGTAQPAELALPLRHARELLGREINPIMYTPAEFDKKRKANDHFLVQVLKKPKIFVIGDKDELGRAAI